MFSIAAAGLIPIMGPLGAGIGMAIEIALTITLGGAFMLVLAITGMFSPGLAIPAFLGEMIPVLDILPGWTVLAITSVVRHRAKEGKGGMLTTISTIALSAAPGGSTGAFQAARTALSTVRSVPASPQERGRAEQARIPLQQFGFARPVDGIRAANDNQPYVKKAA